MILLVGCAQVSSEQPLTSVESTQRICEPLSAEHRYVATCATTTTRDPDTPIQEIPFSTQVITRPVIDDQKALRVGDALRNVSGVQGGH